jgi:hypothetical protein
MKSVEARSSRKDVNSFTALTDAALDAELRTAELELRALHARRARILAATEARGSHRADGHRTIAAYLRATCNTGTASAKRDHTLAKLVADHPAVADSLDAGLISIDHAHEIGRIHTNPRIRDLLGSVLDTLLTAAEHLSLGEFRIQVGTLIALADQDGGFRELKRNVANRRAWVDDLGDALHLSASGGDPLTAAQVVAVFESFVSAELQADLDHRRAEHGDDADLHPLARTQSQRNYDALVSIFGAAAGSPETDGLPEPTVNIIIDDDTLHETLTRAGLILPSGNQIDLDDQGHVVDPEALLPGLVGEFSVDPEAMASRYCHLASGAPIHPSVVLQALLTGHIRRVVVDSKNVVTELGVRSRVFTGAARDAAQLLSFGCTHAGCTVRARHSQIDHMLEWADGGTTSQHNAQPRCGPHNRFKNRERWRTKRDQRGRHYDVRPDGTIVLPVGERPPDLTEDETEQLVRNRFRQLVAES